MSPDQSFQTKVSAHLTKLSERKSAEQQNQIWTVQLFRQAGLQSIQATHSRDAIIEFEKISMEVQTVIKEIYGLLPVIVWIWDNVKNREGLLAHLQGLEDKVRSEQRHHEKHGHFFEMYEENKENGLKLFQKAMLDLVSIFNQSDAWTNDPVATLRRIHDAQDGVILTGLFLETLNKAVQELSLLDETEQNKLAHAISHIRVLGQKLHLKEERLNKVLEAANKHDSL